MPRSDTLKSLLVLRDEAVYINLPELVYLCTTDLRRYLNFHATLLSRLPSAAAAAGRHAHPWPKAQVRVSSPLSFSFPPFMASLASRSSQALRTCRQVYITTVPDSHADRHGITRNSTIGAVRYAFSDGLCGARMQEAQLHIKCHSTMAWTATVGRRACTRYARPSRRPDTGTTWMHQSRHHHGAR